MEEGGLSSASVGATRTLAPLQLRAGAALLNWGWLVGAGFWSPPCSMALWSQLACLGGIWGQSDLGRWQQMAKSMRGLKLNWLMRYVYPGRGRTATTGSQLRGDASRLGWEPATGFELCLCPGWPSGRHETKGGGTAASFVPAVAKTWPVVLPGWWYGTEEHRLGTALCQEAGAGGEGELDALEPCCDGSSFCHGDWQRGGTDGGITSSPQRAEHGGYLVLCPLPVSWSCVTPEDCASWGTARQHQAVLWGSRGEPAPGSACPLGWTRCCSLIKSPVLECNLALAH